MELYNKHVDIILNEFIGKNDFLEKDLTQLVDLTAMIIGIENPKKDIEEIKNIVFSLINEKYYRVYVYNPGSIWNNANKIESDDVESIMSCVSLDDMDDEHEVINSDNRSLSEIAESTDKVSLNNYMDLVCHVYDYDAIKYAEKIYQNRYKILQHIKGIPQYEQKSKEWFAQRNECLTATAVATVLDEDPYKYPITVLMDKCGRAPKFEENENVHHGKKYEPIANMYYAFRNNIKVGEYGLLQHPKTMFIGASPDGICDKSTYFGSRLSKLVGRLVEIKCPFKRKIKTSGDLDGDICPHYYYIQVQTQLYVTGLDECDFLQCEIEEYSSWEDFLQDSHKNIPSLSKKTNLEKGCIIQLLPKNKINEDKNQCIWNSKYIYPDSLHMSHEEIQNWILEKTLNFHKSEYSDEYVFDKVIFWRFKQIACNLILPDKEWISSKLPFLKQYWEYIEYFRNNPNKLDTLEEYIKQVGEESTADIFKRIHKIYMQDNSESKYKPILQDENPWRIKYDEKKKKYAKFNSFKKFNKNN